MLLKAQENAVKSSQKQVCGRCHVNMACWDDIRAKLGPCWAVRACPFWSLLHKCLSFKGIYCKSVAQEYNSALKEYPTTGVFAQRFPPRVSYQNLPDTGVLQVSLQEGCSRVSLLSSLLQECSSRLPALQKRRLKLSHNSLSRVLAKEGITRVSSKHISQETLASLL